MSRLPKVPREEVSGELDALFARHEATGAMIPNAWQIMAHVPEIAGALVQLARAINGTQRKVPAYLKWMVGHVASRAAGCNYCMLHTVSNGDRTAKSDLERQKMDAVWEFETSPLFTEAERAALRVALGAGIVPNAVTDEDFDALRRHFSNEEIVEIVAVISLFGFLNRWNDTMQPELEPKHLDYAAAHDLANRGWSIGAHGSVAAE
jgi:uncharacterized peroxidase-related enzyme